MRIVTEIKELLYVRGISMGELAAKLGKRLNKNYSLANLSNKLRNETITYKEIKIIAEIMNCKVEICEL